MGLSICKHPLVGGEMARRGQRGLHTGGEEDEAGEGCSEPGGLGDSFGLDLESPGEQGSHVVTPRL